MYGLRKAIVVIQFSIPLAERSKSLSVHILDWIDRLSLFDNTKERVNLIHFFSLD